MASADKAIRIRPPPTRLSYLNEASIVDSAIHSSAQVNSSSLHSLCHFFHITINKFSSSFSQPYWFFPDLVTMPNTNRISNSTFPQLPDQLSCVQPVASYLCCNVTPCLLTIVCLDGIFRLCPFLSMIIYLNV